MPWNGSGTYALPPAYSPEVNGTTIDATRYNGLTNDVATGISAALAKNGENAATANLPMGGFKHTGAASANAAGQYLTYGQNLGTVVADAGSVGTPSYTFNGDLNNGWWAPAADTQAWSLAGAERMRLNSTGLGLGVTNPLAAIHFKTGLSSSMIAESTNARGTGQVALALYDPTGLKAYFGYGSTNDQLHVYQGLNAALNFYTNGLQRMDIAAGGNVTIADPTSGYPLTVSANGTLAALFKNSNPGSVSAGIAFGSPGSTNLSAGIAGLAISSSSGALILQAVTGSALFEGARLDASGNFGVGGTAAAGIRLHATGPAGAPGRGAIAGVAGQGAYLSICGNAASPGVASFDLQMDSGQNVDIVNRSNTRMSFYTNGTERLRLNADGSLYGTALHNVGTPTGTTTQYIASGTYTPTGFGVGSGNVEALTPNKAQWMRVGNVVTVSGMVQVNPTLANTNTFFGLSLPIAANFTGASDLAGVANFKDVSDVNRSANVQADITNDRVVFASTSTADTASNDWYYTYSYEVK